MYTSERMALTSALQRAENSAYVEQVPYTVWEWMGHYYATHAVPVMDDAVIVADVHPKPRRDDEVVF